jgi:hypothetical protein
MKNLLIILSTAFILSACSSKNHVDDSSGTVDTSGYTSQPADHTITTDSMQIQNADTTQLNTDTMPH